MAFLSKAVFDYRRGLMCDLMRARDLDALGFQGPDFFQFATNYHTDVRPWERPILVVVPMDGEPFAVMNELSTNHIRMAEERGTLWVTDITLYAEHPKVTARQPLVSQWPEAVAETLRGRGLATARIGLESTGGPMARVSGLLPRIDLVPFEREMRALRLVKHGEELEIMRQAAALSDWVQDRYRENIRPGRMVQELDHAMAGLFAEEGARRFPGENLEVRAWSLSGPPSASPHGDGAPNGQRIEEGHVIVNIVIPRLNGLVIENERTWFCGKPSNRQAAYYETSRAANEAGIEAAVAGNPVAAIDATAQSVIEKAGFAEYIFHRTGHGMGLAGHEFPEDMAFNTRPLMAGEVYSVEPGIYVYGLGGFRMDDSVVIGKTPEVLTKTAKDIGSQTVG